MRFTSSITDVARHFADYVNRVAFRGERFVLMRGKRPVAELVPYSAGRPIRDLPEMLAALPRLTPEEAGAYGDDIVAARVELDSQPLSDPWSS